MRQHDAIVVGSGVIGLSIAHALAGSGRHVALVDAHPGSGASGVAAGMLAPVTEAAFGEEEIAALAIRSAREWPAFAAAVEAASGLSVGFRRDGTLLVAADGNDAADLQSLFEFHQELDLESSWMTSTEARRVEPLLAPSLRGALFAPSDGQVDNRRLLSALVFAARRADVEFIPERVERLLVGGGAIEGVATGKGELGASLVILAAGYESGLLPGLPDSATPPVRPVKGQIIRLRVPVELPRLSTTVRALVAGSSVYVVPRQDGQVVLGATVEDRGADRTLTAGALYGLVRDATRIVPVIAEYELTEFSAGLRPGSFDNAAIIGPTEISGLVLACGHYRNGILFAPVTVDAVLQLVERGELPSWAAPFAPARLGSLVSPVALGHLPR